MYIPHKGSKNAFFVSAVLETMKLNIIIKVKIQPRSKETSHLEEDFLGIQNVDMALTSYNQIDEVWRF